MHFSDWGAGANRSKANSTADMLTGAGISISATRWVTKADRVRATFSPFSGTYGWHMSCELDGEVCLMATLWQDVRATAAQHKAWGKQSCLRAGFRAGFRLKGTHAPKTGWKPARR